MKPKNVDMKVLYCRVSSAYGQKTDRQRVTENEFDEVIEDKCSGGIPFFERPGGMEIKKLVDEEILTSLSVWQIDRLGRSMRDILNTIHYFSERGVCVNFIAQGIQTMNDDGTENQMANMSLAMLGMVAQLEKSLIAERRVEGIRLAKLRGNVYTGRKQGTTETTLTFLSKERNKKALGYLKQGLNMTEVSKLTGLHYNTVMKVKKLGLATY